MRNNDELNAFPLVEPESGVTSVSCGLTKREYFAAMAMQGLLAVIEPCTQSSQLTAKYAVLHADALLEALEAEQS